MPDPVTVWMVQLGGGNAAEVQGVLRLDGDALVFEHAEKPAEVRFPYPTLLRARRVMSSPVLVVEWSDDAQPRRTAFYFVKPPPLHPRSPDELPPSASGRQLGPIAQRRALSQRRHARANLGYLAVGAGRSKPLLQAWVKELRIRMREARA